MSVNSRVTKYHSDYSIPNIVLNEILTQEYHLEIGSGAPRYQGPLYLLGSLSLSSLSLSRSTSLESASFHDHSIHLSVLSYNSRLVLFLIQRNSDLILLLLALPQWIFNPFTPVAFNIILLFLTAVSSGSPAFNPSLLTQFQSKDSNT